MALHLIKYCLALNFRKWVYRHPSCYYSPDRDVAQFDMVENFLKASEFLNELLQLQS